MKSKKILKRNEFYVAVTIFLLSLIIQLRSGQFYTANNFVDLARAMIIPGMLTMGVMMEIISGGIDVSFPAISMLSMYATLEMMLKMDYQGSIALIFLIASFIGLCLGLINGALICWLKLPAFIITLGTSSIYLGFMQAVLKSHTSAILPSAVSKMVKSFLFTVTNQELGISSSLPTAFIFLIVIVIFTWILLKYTMLGRGIYALGGDAEAAERAGFHVNGIRLFVYGFMGCLAGFVGITRTVLVGSCQPNSLIGYEMTCIAAVVLGGTRISGGHGTVIGSLLGALLLTMVSNSLILMGIPTYWSKFVTGVLIIIGTGVSAYQALKRRRQLAANVLEN